MFCYLSDRTSLIALARLWHIQMKTKNKRVTCNYNHCNDYTTLYLEHDAYISKIMSQLMTKPTKWHNRAAKADQPGHLPSLIRVFAVRMKKIWVLIYQLSAQQRLWVDLTDAKVDLSLCYSHMLFCWFWHEKAQFVLTIHKIQFRGHIYTFRRGKSVKQS